MWSTHRITGLVAGAVAGLLLTLLSPQPADAVVLVNAPAPRIQVNHRITVGVWYRASDGGPQAYRVKLENPAGTVIFFRSGTAPTSWRFWHVQLRRVGVYKTIYRTKGSDGTWLRTVFRTTVHR